MVLNVDKKYNLTITNKEKERNKINVVIAKELKQCPAVLRIESITMIDYVAIKRGIAIIPSKFDICNELELSVVLSDETDLKTNIETNRIKVSMKGGS